MIRRVPVIFVLLLLAADLSAADADSTPGLLQKAQTLAWAQHFGEAASIYGDILRIDPESHDAILGLARVRLWQGRYREARSLFGRLTGEVDAAEGAATAAYWSGDYRTAARELRGIVAAHPERDSARRSLNELHAASAPLAHLEVGLVDDDQPFRAARSEARVSAFSDPLTRWDVSAGAYDLRHDAGGRHRAPFAVLQNETVYPSLRLTTTVSLGAIRTPDSKTHAIGGVSAGVRIAPHDSITVGFSRREILSNATHLYPQAGITSVRWQHSAPWLASIGIDHHRFSDHNSAIGADGYALLPVVTRGRWTLWTGASALIRDTRESRFYVTGITSTRDASGDFFHYSYRAAYDPYWTPHDLAEGRLIVAIEGRIASGIKWKLQADGGRAGDRAIVFWPDRGQSPFPERAGSAKFDRTYNPWRLRFTSSTPVARDMTFEFAYEHSVSAFYRANSFHAALARRL
ncbi:MAG: tetratricopeptide repeat protein [Thermoanaerobaculia bacterium]